MAGLLFQATDQPLAVLALGADQGPVALQQQLQTHGFHSMITGILNYAEVFKDACTCPYEVNGVCHCREVVILVYGESGPPLTLVLQCRGPWTCVYLCRSSLNPDNQATKHCLIDLFALQESE